MKRQNKKQDCFAKLAMTALLFFLCLLSIVCGLLPEAFAAGITIGSGASVTVSGGKVTTADVTINGTLDGGTGTLNLSGDWNRTGTFTPSTGTVGITGSGTAVINGTNTFYKLTSTAAGKQINFAAGEKQTITNAFTITGTSANRILLRSTSTGSRWDIDPQGTRAVDYADIKDSYNRNTAKVTASHSKDSGNNINWDFAAALAFLNASKTLISGTVSDAFTVQIKDGTGAATNAAANTTVNLTTTSTGTYEFRGSAAGSAVSSVVIPLGSNQVDFYYQDSQTGSPTLTAASTGLESAVQTQEVQGRTSAASTKWWDTDFTYRRKIVFDNSGQSTDLVSFPVMLRLNTSNFTYTNAQSAGQDIRFMDSDGVSELPYEIEKFNSSGESIIWVRVPQIDAAKATDFIWMYYGNSLATDKQNANSVWDTYYKGVWHLGDAGPATAADSTANANNGTQSGGVTFGASGQVNSAASFDGADNSIEFLSGNFFATPSAISVEGWFKTTSTNTAMLYSVKGAYGMYITAISTGSLLPFFDANSGGDPAWGTNNDGNWHHWTAVNNGVSTLLYVEGELRINRAETIYDINSVNEISRFGAQCAYPATLFFNGTLDEMRISNTARSADWVKATYLNQMTGSTFTDLGQEQTPKLVFTTNEQTFGAGGRSSVLTVQVQDSSNQAVNVLRDIVLDLASTSSTGRLSTDGSSWSSGNTLDVTIRSGTSSVSFYYTDTKAGTPTITASESPSLNWTNTAQTVMVVSGAFSVTASSVVAGSPFLLTVSALTPAGPIDTNYAGSVNLTVVYNSPSAGAGVLAVTSMNAFVNGTAMITNQSFSDCGVINIIATDSVEPTKAGTSSNIDARPSDFEVKVSGLDKDVSGASAGEHIIGKPWTLKVTARNASGVICPNYKGLTDLSINYVSPSVKQNGSLGKSSLTSTSWVNGIAEITDETYNKWGKISITAADNTLKTSKGNSAEIMFIPQDFGVSVSTPPTERDFYYISEEFTATVTARDYAGQTVGNYQGTVKFDAAGLGGTTAEYTFVAADNGTHKFSGVSGTGEKVTVITVKDTVATKVSGVSPEVEVKYGVIQVYSTTGPLGDVSVQVKILDSQGDVITKDSSTSFMVKITEFLNTNSTTTSRAVTEKITVTNGIATIVVNSPEAKMVTVTPEAFPVLAAKSGTIRFGTISGSGVGIQMWREVRGGEGIREAESSDSGARERESESENKEEEKR